MSSQEDDNLLLSPSSSRSFKFDPDLSQDIFELFNEDYEAEQEKLRKQQERDDEIEAGIEVEKQMESEFHFVGVTIVSTAFQNNQNFADFDFNLASKGKSSANARSSVEPRKPDFYEAGTLQLFPLHGRSFLLVSLSERPQFVGPELEQPFSSFFYDLIQHAIVRLSIKPMKKYQYQIEIYAPKADVEAVYERIAKWKAPVRTSRELAPPQERLTCEKRGITVLSLFDGIGGTLLALKRAEIPIKKYYSSEVDEDALSVLKYHYPDEIVHLGCVTSVTAGVIRSIKPDLIVAGSPCQNLSGLSGPYRKGLQGNKSMLFYYFVTILDEATRENPNCIFLLENVASMGDKDMQEIIQRTGVYPYYFDSADVAAASRKRYYWTNMLIYPLPKQTVYLQDVLEPDAIATRVKSKCITSTRSKQTAVTVKLRPNYTEDDLTERHLSELEEELCMGLPENYTLVPGVIDRHKLIGNGFTIPVVQHIFSHIRKYLSFDEERPFIQITAPPKHSGSSTRQKKQAVKRQRIDFDKQLFQRFDFKTQREFHANNYRLRCPHQRESKNCAGFCTKNIIM